MSRESPSAGWREVYEEMGVSTDSSDEPVDQEDWEWSPTIVDTDGEPIEVGSEEDMPARRRREVARLLRDEDGGLTSRQIYTHLRSCEVRTRKTLDELRAAGVVAARRDPNDRRYLRYHWVGGCEVSEL